MTSSLKRKSLSKPVRGVTISPYDLAQVRGRNKNKVHSRLLELFLQSGMSKAELAKMLDKKPEQITRWLGGPGNLKIDTLSDLAFAMSGSFVTVSFPDDLAKSKSNRIIGEWWRPTYDQELTYLPHAKEKKSEHRKVYSASFGDPKSVNVRQSSGKKYEQIAS